MYAQAEVIRDAEQAASLERTGRREIRRGWGSLNRSFFCPECTASPLDHMTPLSKIQFDDHIPYSGRTDHFLCVSLGNILLVMHLKVLTITICDVCNDGFWYGDHVNWSPWCCQSKACLSLSVVLTNRPGVFLNPRAPWYFFIFFHVELRKFTKGSGMGWEDKGVPWAFLGGNL